MDESNFQRKKTLGDYIHNSADFETLTVCNVLDAWVCLVCKANVCQDEHHSHTASEWRAAAL
jgi:hypothetical protein